MMPCSHVLDSASPPGDMVVQHNLHVLACRQLCACAVVPWVRSGVYIQHLPITLVFEEKPQGVISYDLHATKYTRSLVTAGGGTCSPTGLHIQPNSISEGNSSCRIGCSTHPQNNSLQGACKLHAMLGAAGRCFCWLRSLLW